MKKTSFFLLAVLISFLMTVCGSEMAFPTPAIIAAPVTAGSTETFPSRYPVPDIHGVLRFERIGLEEGLSQSVVNTILQDRYGFLWVGTADGLNRYDGYSFEVFRPDPDDAASISDRWITALLEDRRGDLWIGTFLGGLNRFDYKTGKFTPYVHESLNENSLAGNHVTALLEDQQGFLWIGTKKGLDRFDPRAGVFEHFRNIPGDATSLPGNSINALNIDSQGVLWVGTNTNGLCSFNAYDRDFRCYLHDDENPNSLSSNTIHDIVEDSQGFLWVATPAGINRISPDRNVFIHYVHDDDLARSLIDNYVHALFIDRAGILWVGTENGLDRYDFDSYRFIHYRHNPGDITSLSNNSIYAVYEDRGGVLWVGTYGSGLNKYNSWQSKFTYFNARQDPANSLSSDFVFPISVDDRGMVWIGTYGGGLNLFNPRTGRFTHYRHDPKDAGSLLSDVVISSYIDRKGVLWVGTNEGLSRFDADTGTFVHYTARKDEGQPDANITPGTVFDIYEDSQGFLWVGTEYGLNRFDPVSERFTHYTSDPLQPDTLSSSKVTAIFEDRDQNLWFGTFDNGLNRFDRQKRTFTRYLAVPQKDGSLSHSSVLAIYQDSRGILWIATAGGGLNRYHPDTDSFSALTEKHGLPNNVLYGILEDDGGDLWLTTNRGLSRYDPEAGTFRNYTTQDGLQSIEFNQNAFAKGPDGLLYVGGINGLNGFDPAAIVDSAYAPPVVLTSFSNEGQPEPDRGRPEVLQHVTLGWPDNSFTFEFAALSYAQSDANQYAYFLENFDREWNYIGTSREGRYTNLPGGTYTLRLRGTNNDGVWNEIGQSVNVTVIPPFWDTWIFRILVAFAVIGLGVGAYRVRMRAVEAQNIQLEHLVSERTSALQKRTEELEALYSGDEKIIRAMTLDQIFQAIVEVAVKMLHADRSVVFVWDGRQKRILPRVSHGFSSDTLAVLNFGKGEGIVGKVLESGEPLVIPAIDFESIRPDVRAAIVAEGIHSLVHLPIKVHEQVIGVFNVGFTRPTEITDDTVRLFTAMVQRAALSIENMQLFEQTKELAVIEERNRVARDLHDSAKQKAFAALAQLGAMSGILKNDPANVWTHLGEAENLVYEVIQELTFLIQEMYPMALKEKGLATTLREYVFEWENRNGVMINLIIKGQKRMELATEQAIYRMIQEALANVARHSQANKVDVSLLFNNGTVEVVVQDNGVGFEVKRKSSGMGLRTIQERAESIGGQACIQSEPGKGTKVIITSPFTCKE